MRCKLVNFACPQKLREDYDQWWKAQGFNSRAHAIKDGMRDQMARSRVPPAEMRCRSDDARRER